MLRVRSSGGGAPQFRGAVTKIVRRIEGGTRKRGHVYPRSQRNQLSGIPVKELEGSAVLSNHRPVTAKIAWPRTTDEVKEILSASMYLNVTRPLDPLEPAWGIVDE